MVLSSIGKLPKRHVWPRLPALILGAVLGFTNAGPAQTGGKTDSPPANRFLFVIENSRSMQRRAQGVMDSVQTLLNSSLKNQLRTGDTVGVWTYNDRLYTGKFPLERWTPDNQATVAVHLLGFLKSLTYEKKASFDKVLPDLARVIQDSEFITIIVLSSGEEKMRGTPFDDRINAAYKQWQDEAQKAKGPFVTVLRAKAGRFTDWLVTPSSWPPELPPLPPELQISQANDGISTRAAAQPSPSTALDSGLRLSPPRQATISNAPPPAPPLAKAEPVKPPEKKPSNVSTQTNAPLPSATSSTPAVQHVEPPPTVAKAPAAAVPSLSAPIRAAVETQSTVTAQAKSVPVAPETPPPALSPKPASAVVETTSTTRQTPPASPPATQPQSSVPPTNLTEAHPLGEPAGRSGQIAPPPTVSTSKGDEEVPPATVHDPNARSQTADVADQRARPMTGPTQPAQDAGGGSNASLEPTESHRQRPSAALPVPHESLGSSIIENGVWWALLLLAGLTAAFCFRMWLRTFVRTTPVVESTPAAPEPQKSEGALEPRKPEAALEPRKTEAALEQQKPEAALEPQKPEVTPERQLTNPEQ